MKQILCRKCNSPYEPLMELNGNVLCPICEKIEVLTLTELKKSDWVVKNNSILQEFDNVLKDIEYPGELFLASISEHGQNIKMNMRDGIYSINFLKSLVYYQFLLERMVLLGLDITKMHPVPPGQRPPIDFHYIEPFLDQALKAKRLNKDLFSGETVYARKKGSMDDYVLHITSKKVLIGTPVEIGAEIYRRNPHPLKYIGLHFRKFFNSIFDAQDPELQTLNIGSKIWTDFFKFTSTKPIENSSLFKFVHAPIWFRIMADIIEGSRFTTTIGTAVFFLVDFLPSIKKYLYIVLNNSPNYKLKMNEQEFMEYSDELIDFFSQPDTYHCLFFRRERNLVCVPDILYIFDLMIDSQINFLNDFQLKKRVTRYRGFSVERYIFNLSLHIDIVGIFEDQTPMMNVVIPIPDGNLEMDVILYKDGILELIECKSDIGMTILTQEKYYRKLLKKIPEYEKFFKSKGYDIKKTSTSLISYVCTKIPPSEINVFLSEIHFLESFISKYGLFDWKGMSLFEKYPIIACIGWNNIDVIDKMPLSLNEFIKQTDTFLCLGKIEKDQISIEFKETYPKKQLNQDSLKGFNYEILDALVIYDQLKQEIIDYLILPPYWNEPHNDFAHVNENVLFHNTSDGQKFLLTAILNGVFGYCPKCKIIPLIPYGFGGKPAHSSALAECLKCGHEEDLDRFDAVSFRDYPELKEKIRSKIKERFQIEI